MSSSPPPDRSAAITEPLLTAPPVDPGRATPSPSVGSPRTRRPLTLRSKLIIGIVALITAVCAVIGVTTEIFLSRYLVRQVDAQLTQQQKFTHPPDSSRNPGYLTPLACTGSALTPGGGGPPGFGPGAAVNSLTAFVLDGELVSSNILTSTGNGSLGVGSSRVDLQACKLEYSIVSPK